MVRQRDKSACALKTISGWRSQVNPAILVVSGHPVLVPAMPHEVTSDPHLYRPIVIVMVVMMVTRGNTEFVIVMARFRFGLRGRRKKASSHEDRSNRE